MRSKCCNGVSYLIPLSITTIMLCVTLSLLKYNNTMESLQDFGEADSSLNAPLSYESTMENIKYPNLENPIYDLGNTRYNNNVFNREDASDQYSDFQVTQDLKYFNNASNILLKNYFSDNRTTTTKAEEPINNYLHDNSITQVAPIYNYEFSVSQEEDIQPYEVYDALLSYDNEVLPGLEEKTKYSSYYFESNFSDISNSVTKDFEYFNSVASILAGGTLFN